MPRSSHSNRILAFGAFSALTLALSTVVLTGCSEEPPPPPPPPPPVVEPPPPPKPTVTPISQLMKELGISNKIRLAEEHAPATEPERVAVLKFFDAFAKSDAAPIKAAVSEQDRLVLELMEKTGSFKKSTDSVSRVDLVTGTVGGNTYVWADFQADDLHQWQLWKFTVSGEARKIESQEFNSYVQPLNVAQRITIKGDRAEVIPEWIKLVAADMALANQPDEVLKPPQRVQKDEEGTTTAKAGDGPIAAPPMRRPPPREPIKPPDFKPGGN